MASVCSSLEKIKWAHGGWREVKRVDLAPHQVHMPSAYDVCNEYSRCSYATGVAYVSVEFPDDPTLNFVFAVVGMDHDT